MKFVLAAHNFETLQAKLAPLNKRAVKLGLPLVTVLELGRETKLAPFKNDGKDVYGDVVTVEVDGIEPKVGEYEFVATLDHREGNVIIRSMPGLDVELPERFRGTDKTCDHCQLNRVRREVFVVRGTGGDFKQIGRQCIKDFLGGVDPTALAAFLQELGEFYQYVHEDCGEGGGEGWFGGAGFEPLVTATNVLERTAQALRMYGWVPRSQRDYSRPTADRVVEALFGRDELATEGLDKAPVYYNEKYTGGATVRATNSGLGNLDATEADKELAGGALAHVATLAGKTDFEHNLKVLCENLEYVKGKDVGFVAAAVMVYERFLGNEAKWKIEREQKTKLLTGGKLVGQVGKRMTAELTYVDHKSFGGDYGPRTLVTFADADGNTLKWWASGDVLDYGLLKGIERAQLVGLCAFTPKKHGEYNGAPETTVTRVSPAPVKAAKKAKAA